MKPVERGYAEDGKIRTLGRLDGDLVKDGNLDTGDIVDQHLDLVLSDGRDALDDLVAARNVGSSCRAFIWYNQR